MGLLLTNNINIKMKIYRLFIIPAMLLFLSGCVNEENNKNAEDDTFPAPNVMMQLRSGTASVYASNASIYVFTDSDRFIEKKRDVIKNENVLSTYMLVGTWNLALLTYKTNSTGSITPPSYMGDRNSPMWKTGYEGAGNQFLSQTPSELRFASLPNVNIIENQITNLQATLNRNVAKIQVILKKYDGFDEISAGQNTFAFVDLLDVPTTLDWMGRYYPRAGYSSGKDYPEHSGEKPIREYFNFVEVGEDMIADTVNFIVPAHRGSDAFDIQHDDTTTHKLRLQVSMPLNKQSYFGKTPFYISFVPKINRIIQVILTFRGEPDTFLDVKLAVKEWEKPIDQYEEFK